MSQVFSFQKINGIYGVVYAPLTEIGTLNINTYSYSFIPKCYTHMDLGSLSASGITRLQEHPYLQLKEAEQLLRLWILELTIGIRFSERNGQQNPLYLGPDLRGRWEGSALWSCLLEKGY